METVSPLWHHNILLKGLSAEQLAEIDTYAREVHFEKGAIVIQEGDQGFEFFFVLSGSLEVLHNGFRIHVTEAGDLVGELAILGSEPRIATVRALEPSITKAISVKHLSQDTLHQLAKNLNLLFTTRLSTANQQTADALRKELFLTKRRVLFAQTALFSAVGLTLYTTIASLIIKYLPAPYFPLFSSTYTIGMTYVICRAWIGPYPLSWWGLTFRNWKRSIIETTIFTIPLLLSLLILKKILITTNIFPDQPLFRLGLESTDPSFDKGLLSAALLVYVLSAPVQELMFRGLMQTSWQRLIPGRNKTVIAIAVTTILYVSAHFYWSFSPLVAIPSILWGWLFARHRTIIGVSLGHMALGTWLFYILGLPQ